MSLKSPSLTRDTLPIMTPNHDPNDMRVSDQQSNPLFSRAADFLPIQLATPHQYYTCIAYDPVFFRSQYCLYDPN